MGLDHSMQLILSGVLNITQLVGVSTSIWSMDNIGRKPLLMYGSFFMFISHFVIAILVGKFSGDWPSHRGAGWVCAGFLFFYMLCEWFARPENLPHRNVDTGLIAFGASWGPVPWAMPAEIFPSSLRAKGVALATSTNWLMNFIVVSFTQRAHASLYSGAVISDRHRGSLHRPLYRPPASVPTHSLPSSVFSHWCGRGFS